MFLISKKKKFIFIHIPRTAGTSIEETFLEDSNLIYRNKFLHFLFDNYIHESAFFSFFSSHTTALNVSEKSKNYDAYFSFAISRNPYSWLVSVYHYTLNRFKNNENYFSDLFPYIKQSKNFREFAIIIAKNQTVKSFQKRFVVDENGKQIVEYIGKFEDLENEIEKIKRKVNVHKSLVHKNKSDHESFENYYDDELKDIIYEAFIDDFLFFNYPKLS